MDRPSDHGHDIAEWERENRAQSTSRRSVAMSLIISPGSKALNQTLFHRIGVRPGIL